MTEQVLESSDDSQAPQFSAVEVLEHAVSKMGGVTREGQTIMTREVERSLKEKNHLLVEAGTGTGKSLAYLVPALIKAASSNKTTKIVVSTATKHLQEQLVEKDLPFLQSAFKDLGLEFSFAILKGRSNYACLAKVDDLSNQPTIFSSFTDDEANLFADWVETTKTGDRAEIDISNKAWGEVSVETNECPGAQRCPFGSKCFTERARSVARESDLIVVNTSLYGADLAFGSKVLPPHDNVIFDEAHTLEDIMAEAFSFTVGPGKIGKAASLFSRVISDPSVPKTLRKLAGALEMELTPLEGKEVDVNQEPLKTILTDLRVTLAKIVDDVTPLVSEELPPAAQALSYTMGLLEAVEGVVNPTSEISVTFVEKFAASFSLKTINVDMAPVLAEKLFKEKTVIAASATLAVGGKFDDPARRLGVLLEPAQKQKDDTSRPSWRRGVAPSPFDYSQQGLLYMPPMPDPRSDEFFEKMTTELDALIKTANGRTMALFTSYQAMRSAAEHLDNGDYEILMQGMMPRSEMLNVFKSSPGSTIFATQGFWTGVDISGNALINVTIDRIPFARPNDPLWNARRNLARSKGANPFMKVDVPRAANLLAQGAGRLIRTSQDRGVVTIFDPRFASSSYSNILQSSLPPFRRTRKFEEVKELLQKI